MRDARQLVDADLGCAAPAHATPQRGRGNPGIRPAAVPHLEALSVSIAIVATRASRPVPSPDSRVMLAVLPFANLSGDPQQDYFRFRLDGIILPGTARPR